MSSDELTPAEAERARRRDRRRVTRMVVDGAGLRRQQHALAARAGSRQRERRADGTPAEPLAAERR